jgi:hypothetical protein
MGKDTVMGLSGYVGAGALDELERMVAQQNIEKRMKMNEEGEAFDRQIRQLQFEAQQQERHEASGVRQRHEAQQQAALREQRNVRGVNEMMAQRKTMDEQEAEAALDADVATLPEPVRRIVNLKRRGVPGVTTEDLQTPEERAAAQKAAEDADVQRAGRMADAQYAAAARHRAPEKSPPTGPTGLSPQQERAAMSFMDDYARDSKPFLTMRDAYQRVASASPDAAGDLSMIFAYMKILDPNSVVRETEFANAQNAAGVPDQIRNAYNRAIEGVRLNPTQRQQFTAQAEKLFTNAKQNQDRVRQTYTTRAERWGIPTDLVLDAAETPSPDAAGPITVTAPNGKTYSFPDAEKAAQFRASVGGK